MTLGTSHFRRIVYSGCIGDGNVGDELILLATLQFLNRTLGQGAQYCVISTTPEETASAYGVESILSLNFCKPRHWYGLFVKGKAWPLLRALRQADLVLVGAGDSLRDDVGLSHFLGMAERAILAKLLGAPYALWNTGIGPLNTRRGRRLARWLLSHAAFVYHRDPVSASRAKTLVDRNAKASWWTFPDIVFLFQSREKQPAKPVSSQGFVVFAPLDFECAGHRYQQAAVQWPQWQEALKRVICQFLDAGFEVLLVPFDRGDIGFQHRLAEAVGRKGVTELNKCLSPLEIQEKISAAQGFVGMRLHACILALASGVPTVGLVYDEKVQRTLAGIGMEDCTMSLTDSPGQLDFASVTALHERCRSRLPALRANLSAMREQMDRELGQAIVATSKRGSKICQ